MAIDLNVMAANIQSILAAVPGMAAAYDHEPQALNPLPAATLYFDGFGAREDTIGRVEYEWRWTIRVYVPISTTDIKSPQVQLRTLTTETLKTLRSRANITLNNSCLYSVISSGDVYNIMNATTPLMVSEITLAATTQENI